MNSVHCINTWGKIHETNIQKSITNYKCAIIDNIFNKKIATFLFLKKGRKDMIFIFLNRIRIRLSGTDT